MIKINNFDHQGRGISKFEDKIIFVNNALPGEIIEPKITKENKKYLEASVKNYIKTSKDRIIPKCPFYSECGGCHIMHIPYEKQLEFKQDKIINIFKKYLNENTQIKEILGCDTDLFYRNKITFQVNNDIGFFKKGTNDFISIDKCILCDDIINNSIPYLKRLDLQSIKKIICKSGNGELMIIIESNDIKLNVDILKNIASSIYIKNNNCYNLIYGNKNIYETIGKYKFLVSPDSFFQVNLNVVKKLYDEINKNIEKNSKILDLYCGTGSIGIYVSDNNSVVGVELNEQAYNDALKNKEINNISNIKFICGDSGKKIKNINKNFDVIIVDPPRSGLNSETINNILEFNSKKIIYVSCDPMTLVRDLKTLNDKYDIKSVTPFDMFPNTYHIECVCLLTLKN